MKAVLFSLLLLVSLNAEKFSDQGVAGPSGVSKGPKTSVIYQPANDVRIEPVVFNSRAGAPNLNRVQPGKLHNPIADTKFPAVIPGDVAAPDAPTIVVFDKDNMPAGLEEFIANNPGSSIADSLDDVQGGSPAPDREMFEVPKTITVGVDSLPGFNNDVEHLPITTLLKGDHPIDEPTYLKGVERPSIPGIEIAPISISDMPKQYAVPILPPAVPEQYRLAPGQARQGLNFSTYAFAPKIIMPWNAIPNVVELNSKLEPFHQLQTVDGLAGEGINDGLQQANTVIPVADKILTRDSEERDSNMQYPKRTRFAYKRDNKPKILRVGGDVSLQMSDAAPKETIVGSSA